jgi:hypothetical protein
MPPVVKREDASHGSLALRIVLVLVTLATHMYAASRDARRRIARRSAYRSAAASAGLFPRAQREQLRHLAEAGSGQE